MFWNKKEDRRGLPDLPPIQSPFSKELALSSKAPEIHPPEKELPEELPDKHALPSFPDSPLDKGFSQAAIKEAINDEPTKLPEIKSVIRSQPDKKFKIIEMNEPTHVETENPYLSSVSQLSSQKPSSIPSFPPKFYEMDPVAAADEAPLRDPEERPFEKPVQKSNDIFVKIDKFYSAKKALDEIKGQIDDVDNLLKKIRETKLKEERELTNWEKEITLAKSKIQNVSETIFEKI